MPLTNYELKLDLSWSKECIISEISITPGIVGNPDANPPVQPRAAIQTAGTTSQIYNVKLYVPVVTIKFLENIKQGLNRIIQWNKYKSEITTQPKNNNLDYLMDPTFWNIDRLFVLSFKNGNDDPTRDSFDKYYMPLVEIKDFNAFIDNKEFFNHPLKNKQEAH